MFNITEASFDLLHVLSGLHRCKIWHVLLGLNGCVVPSMLSLPRSVLVRPSPYSGKKRKKSETE